MRCVPFRRDPKGSALSVATQKSAPLRVAAKRGHPGKRGMIIRKAVIPAAGFGTRMLPAAKAVPKEMLPVLDRPVIQYVVEEAAGAGIDDVLMVVSRGK